MKNWLYAWELGGGLGHLTRMGVLSAALEERGDRVTWCVPAAFQAEARARWPSVLVAPDHRPAATVTAPGSLAEILQNEGWSDHDRLRAWKKAWQDRFQQTEADGWLLDYAPNALFTAVAAGNPIHQAGTGFYLPPSDYPLPAVRDDHGIYPDRLQWAEDRIVEMLGSVLPGWAGDGLQGLFHHPAVTSHLLTWNGLDHYRNRADADYLGVPYRRGGVRVDWSTRDRPRMFAYLKPFPQLAHLLRIAGQLGEVQVFGAREVGRVVTDLGLSSVRFHPEPVDETHLAGSEAVLIHHAGHDGSYKALVAGVPLFQLPINIEQAMTARNCADLGASRWTSLDQPDRFESELQGLLNDADRHRQAARQWAANAPGGEEALQRVMERL